MGICQAGTQTCGANHTFGPCEGEELPQAESCNSQDDDCNGQSDDGLGQTTCGVGACQRTVNNCANGLPQTCTPGAPAPREICNNGIDEDCDGVVDNPAVCNTPLPPDPSTVAPPLSRSTITPFGTSTEFLYTGSNPIQTGVASGTIEPRRAAVLRGKVLDRTNAALSGVTITILNHPEFGQTASRADGMFDMAVNGGRPLTVSYCAVGFLPAQRQVSVPWQDFVMAPDVHLIPLDPTATAISVGAAAPAQVAQGPIVTDADGTRRATLFFPPGTQAELVMPDGSTQPAAQLTVHATEYTVGPMGPKTMPAELPPTSAYTYAVEFSADEAIAAGATGVRFSAPVYAYVENFLDFPVGTIVPAGSYDRSRGAWMAEDNGRIVKIVSIAGGLADVDTDGDGVADNGLGITTAERQQLASLYAVGQTLWRTPLMHFTAVDLNYSLFGGALKLPTNDPGTLDQDCHSTGSDIECQNQILGEMVNVVGTPVTLHYTSDRMLGRAIPAASTWPPAAPPCRRGLSGSRSAS